jgi:TetR/AcrR family transcriptional regulator
MVKEADIQTEEKIFNAATAVFEEKGFAAARMQEIADRAGINKALLHYYFRSKEQLFGAVFPPLMRKMFEKIFSIFGLDIPLDQKLRMYYDEHINILIKNPKLPLFILNEITHNPDLMKDVASTDHYALMRDNVFKRHEAELKEYGIGMKDMSQLMVSVVSLALFPFAARDVMKIMVPQLGDNKSFNAFMQERKTFAADFVISALKNRKK